MCSMTLSYGDAPILSIGGMNSVVLEVDWKNKFSLLCCNNYFRIDNHEDQGRKALLLTVYVIKNSARRLWSEISNCECVFIDNMGDVEEHKDC